MPFIINAKATSWKKMITLAIISLVFHIIENILICFMIFLSSLIDQHTEVCSGLTSTSEELVKLLARAVTMYACSDSNHARTSFLDEINTAHKRLDSTAAEVQTLARLYYKIRQDYHTLHTSAAKAVKAAQLSDYQNFLVYSQTSWMDMIGIDAYSAYVLPLKEKGRQEEEIRLGVAVLERELQRLKRILRVVQGLEHNLLVLATYVKFWDAKFENESNNALYVLIKDLCQHVCDLIPPRYSKHDVAKPRGEDCVRSQKQLQEWLRQPIWHQLLKLNWNELLASVEEGEEKLAIKVTTEWCER